jgi:hypothetical protein
MKAASSIDWLRLATALEAGFSEAARAVDEEQAVRGLDSRSELELHPLIGASIRRADFEVYCEERFPSERSRRRRNEGARCDFVVTPVGTALVHDGAQLGLFDPEHMVTCEDAGWLEVKVIAQHRESGPNSRYAYALQHPVWGDVRKLVGDPAIVHGAVLLVLFTADCTVAEHDLGVWATRASMTGLPLAPRITSRVAIGDRLGNRVCTLALFPIERPLGWPVNDKLLVL